MNLNKFNYFFKIKINVLFINKINILFIFKLLMFEDKSISFKR